MYVLRARSAHEDERESGDECDSFHHCVGAAGRRGGGAAGLREKYAPSAPPSAPEDNRAVWLDCASVPASLTRLGFPSRSSLFSESGHESAERNHSNVRVHDDIRLQAARRDLSAESASDRVGRRGRNVGRYDRAVAVVEHARRWHVRHYGRDRVRRRARRTAPASSTHL